MAGSGTQQDPWVLKTPPGTSEFRMWRDEEADPPALVCQVGSTKLGYQMRAIEDLHAMLKQHGDWMELGAADEQNPAKDGTVEAWGRSPDNPWVVGTARRRATGGDSGCTCHRSWRSSGWRSWSTARGTTGCAPSRRSDRRVRGRGRAGRGGLPEGLRGTVGFRHVAFEDVSAGAEPNAYDLTILSWSLC